MSIERRNALSDVTLKMSGASARKERPPTARGMRTRSALLDAARTVFERDGFLDARLADITAEAHVSVGTFYSYFANKEEIFLALLEDLKEDVLHPALLSTPTGERPEELITTSLRHALESFQRNAKMMRLLEQVATFDEDFADYRRVRGGMLAEHYACMIEDLQARGSADPQLDARIAARALSAMVGRMAYISFVLGAGYSVDDLVETISRLWINGLKLQG